MMYSNTGVSGSVTGVRSDRQLVLYDWLIPNRNTDQHIGIVVRSTCVGCRKGLECGGYGRIILGGDEGALMLCTSPLSLVLVCGGGIRPSAV